MVASQIDDDPHFAICGIRDQRRPDREWVEVEGMHVRTPKFDLSSALVFIGAPADDPKALLDDCLGWVVLAPADPGSESLNRLPQLLRRLGVAFNQTLLVAFPSAWPRTLETWKQIAGSSAVFVASPHDALESAFPGKLSLTNAYSTTLLEITNRQELRRSSTVLIPDSFVTDSSPIPTVVYSSRYVAPNVRGGYRKIYLSLSGALSALTGGGSPGNYLSATLTGGHNPPFGGWLSSLARTNAIDRTSGLKFSVGPAELSLYGFDIRHSLPATGWAARSHSLRLSGESTGHELSVRLGALRREVLDTLGGGFATETQSYAAFAPPQGKPVDLSRFPSDRYRVEVLDEKQEDLVGSGHLDIARAESSETSHRYTLELSDGKLFLEKSDAIV